MTSHIQDFVDKVLTNQDEIWKEIEEANAGDIIGWNSTLAHVLDNVASHLVDQIYKATCEIDEEANNSTQTET